MPHLKLLNNIYLKFMVNYTVVEGLHKNPNEIKTINKKTQKEYGPFTRKDEADSLAKSLIQKNIDDFYHRAWVIKNIQ
jgi:hypothetical protein